MHVMASPILWFKVVVVVVVLNEYTNFEEFTLVYFFLMVTTENNKKIHCFRYIRKYIPHIDQLDQEICSNREKYK